MKSTDYISKKILVSDNLIIDKISSLLKNLQSRNIISGLYVGNDQINSDLLPLLKISWKEINLDEYELRYLISKLTDLGYICSDVKDADGCFLWNQRFFYPSGLYFHVNYQLSLFQKIKFFFQRYILQKYLF